MVSINTLSIIGLAALVAPGFISVLLATTIGVVEREPSRFKILIASLISSLLIDTAFLGVYQVFYEPITGLGQLETIFFTPSFRLDLVAIYLSIAIVLGLVYSLELIYEVRSKIQHVFWSRSEYRRHRRQPWEGAMDEASVVRVKMPSNARVIGRVREYSRAEKPHELWLDEIYWVDEETDIPFSDGVTESVVLLEGDIERVTVLD
jgi:hypothetical protein